MLISIYQTFFLLCAPLRQTAGENLYRLCRASSISIERIVKAHT